MKVRKIGWLVLVIIFLLSIASIYIFIPREIDVSASRLVRCNVNAAFRNAGDESSWRKWWPAGADSGYSYHVGGQIYPNVEVRLKKGERSMPGTLTSVVAGLSDSTILFWKCRLSGGNTPWSRVAAYREAISVKKKMVVALSSLGVWLEKPANAYGIDLHKVMLRDSALMVLQRETATYPSTADIYRWIHSIRNFVNRKGAKETNFPMLHVNRLTVNSYQCMVAIPIDRTLKPGEGFIFRRFVPWKALAGEVHGDARKAEEAMDQLQRYVSDYQIVAMAIPFQSLATERDREPDSTRWVTRVIVPIP